MARTAHERTRRGAPLLAAAAAMALAAIALVGCNSDTQAALPPGTLGSLVPDSTGCGTLGPIDGTVPSGLGPGDLVKSEELTSANKGSPGFPTGARAWRILYVSTGVDEKDLVLICGMVAAPEAGVQATAGTARMLGWSHGTVGLAQRCLPSNSPATMLWGSMPGGINAPGFADPLGIYTGDPAGGALQYAMNQGWVVATTDYQPDDTYVIGKVAAANVLDSTRAAAQLVVQEKVGTAPDRYDLVTWGHSQGGHAALWAGQLAETYLTGTTPSKPTPPIALAGVVALAPASTFTSTPTSTPTSDRATDGHGLADWEMHKTIEIFGLPIQKFSIAIGPALFSYIFGSWADYSQNRPPAADAAFPAFPAAAPKLDAAGVLTAQGQGTVGAIQELCLQADSKAIQAAVNPYIDARTNQMLVPSVWNLPTTYTPGDFFPGGLDPTCATTTDAKLEAWCTWIRWNMPGPRGDNPFPKVPMRDGKPVPMLIGQGLDDTVIHCQPVNGAPSTEVPDAGNCMSRALFDDLSATYCPAGGAPAAYLALDTVRKDGLGSPATHQSIPGQLSSSDWTMRGSQMTFTGSPVQLFMSGAFGGTLEPGCAAKVLNP